MSFAALGSLTLCAILASAPLPRSDAQQPHTKAPLPAAGAKIFIHPMPDGFDAFLREAFVTKKLDVLIVASRDAAEFEIKGVSETQPSSVAKKIFLWRFGSTEDAAISVADIKSGEIVFAYTVHKENSVRGKRSSAEACAKHLKDEMDKAKKK